MDDWGGPPWLWKPPLRWLSGQKKNSRNDQSKLLKGKYWRYYGIDSGIYPTWLARPMRIFANHAKEWWFPRHWGASQHWGGIPGMNPTRSAAAQLCWAVWEVKAGLKARRQTICASEWWNDRTVGWFHWFFMKEVALSIFFDLVRGRTHANSAETHGKAGRRGNNMRSLSNIWEDPRLG